MHFFEEVAKFRAARRMWARIMTERFEAKDPRSAMLRFHTQTGGATLTAQQPQNNIVRTALEAMAAVLGGTQSLHTNSFDEALALPTERAVKIALRTQQVIGYETGVANVADPLGGSYYVESLTDELERLALRLTRPDRGDGRRRGARSRPASTRTQIHDAAFRDPAGHRVRRPGRRRRQPVRRRRRAAGRAAGDLGRGRARRRSSGCASCGPRVTPVRWREALEAVERAAAGDREPVAADEGGAAGAAPRSARCPTSCASVFGEYRPAF